MGSSTERPVMIVHISGHFASVNSKGLELIGYTADTPDPEGGIIRRRPDSNEPNGVLEEIDAPLDAVVLLDVDFDVLLKRITGRRTCGKYHELRTGNRYGNHRRHDRRQRRGAQGVDAALGGHLAGAGR